VVAVAEVVSSTGEVHQLIVVAVAEGGRAVDRREALLPVAEFSTLIIGQCRRRFKFCEEGAIELVL
jgi:hypothetical protein